MQLKSDFMTSPWEARFSTDGHMPDAIFVPLPIDPENPQTLWKIVKRSEWKKQDDGVRDYTFENLVETNLSKEEAIRKAEAFNLELYPGKQ
jgi:hypothetical protein